jgi:4-amino-4-deoxy-L-arabinose transferase-like glycosyltransferase
MVAFHGDESEWISDGIKAANLIMKGDFSNIFWFSGPDWYQAPVPKYILGFWLRIFGISSGEWRYWPGLPASRGNFSIPPQTVLGLARIPAAIFGALTCALTFFVGKHLAAKSVGIFSSLLLLSEPLFLLSSRRAMADTPALFFGVLGVYIYIYWHQQGKYSRYSWFWVTLLGGELAVAVATKYSFFTLIILILSIELIILARHIWKSQRITLGRIFKHLILFLVSFILVSVIVNPYLWPSPIAQILRLIKAWGSTEVAVWWTFPSISATGATFIAGLFNSIFFPLFMGLTIGDAAFTWQFPGTYSTISISIFFFIGLATLFRLRHRGFGFSFALLSMWLATYFVFLSLSLRAYFDRYFLPLLPGLSIIAAIGLQRVLRICRSGIERIIVVALTIILSVWASLSVYKSIWGGTAPTTGNFPQFATMQDSLSNPYVIILALFYLVMIAYLIGFDRGQNGICKPASARSI